ncbi:hypothetical protein GCG21_08905 [Pseudactinotalea sp. HY160]|uniref:hypothetical protein n=1 Tax=Pseudactinotalea sp. HY160 TaxID=2654490 RepID=UPI00128E4040|nr:hypothetical protein [Pseudactinotalea sp. HY160]MPV50123.1 hypothetical protein [Pseudactinotalea sp. HY160]
MTRRPAPARQPAGLPIGGQFAQARRAPAGIALADPWDEAGVDLLDPWDASDTGSGFDSDSGMEGMSTAARELAEAVRTADDISMVVSPTPSVFVSSPAEEKEAVREFVEEINAARRTLIAEHGSVEAATRHVGEKVAARAEELAGITALEAREKFQVRLDEATRVREEAEEALTKASVVLDEVGTPFREMLVDLGRDQAGSEEWKAVRAARDEAVRPHKATYDEALQRFRDASSVKNRLKGGSDPQAQEDLRRLADGYQAAIGEVRGVGGQMVWNDRSAKKAREAFDEAAAVFPSDWIDASNEKNREETRRYRGHTVSEGSVAPFVKLSDRRAHYIDQKMQKKTTRGIDRTLSRGFGEKDMATWGRSTDPYREYVPLTREERDERGGVEGAMWRTHYTVARYWEHGSFDEDTPPRGRGWEKWVSPEDPSRTAWRRPKTVVNTTGYTNSPQITTNSSGTAASGRTSTFATSAHELSHRFEHAVSGIGHLEGEFVKRRTTDPATGEREPLKRLYSRSREYARPDNFITSYMGKEYGGGTYHEVLSMGTEAIYGGTSGGLIGMNGKKPDEDMRTFILGVHASAGRKRR